MALYSSVQTYEQKKQPFQTRTSNQGNDWLKKTLQKRLDGAVRRSSSWKPSQTLNSSIMSGESLRGSSYTRVTASAQGKDNKVMQKIVENLSYLNLSRQEF